MQNMKKERQLYIDLDKVISALMIVIFHTFTGSYSQLQESKAVEYMAVAGLGHQLLYMGVPVFMLLTGSGFLSSDKVLSYKNLWPYIRKVILCIAIFNSFFELLNIVIANEERTAWEFLKNIITGSSWDHMWYLTALMAVYIIMPMLGAYVRNVKYCDRIIMTLVGFIVLSLIPYINQLFDLGLTIIFPISMIFVFYLLAGNIIEGTNYKDLYKIRWVFLVTFVLSVIWIAITGYRGEIHLENSPFTVIASISFLLLIKIFVASRQLNLKLIQTLSKACLGIYLIHPIFIHIVVRILKFNPWCYLPGVSIVLLGFIIYVICAGIVMLARKISLVRNYIW